MNEHERHLHAATILRRARPRPRPRVQVEDVLPDLLNVIVPEAPPDDEARPRRRLRGRNRRRALLDLYERACVASNQEDR